MLFGIRFYSQGQPGTPFQGAWLQRMRRAFSSVPGAGVAANLYSEARAPSPSAFKSSSFRKGVIPLLPEGILLNLAI